MKYRYIKNIFRFALCFVLAGYTLLLGLLNFSYTEQALTRFVAKQLSEKLGTEVSIGNIEVGLFNRLMLDSVTIKDRQRETLLNAKRVTAKIELRSLFKHQLALRTVSLLDANVNLYKQKADSATNFQFFLDAFASKDQTKKSELDLRINSIILRRTNISYNELYAPQTLGMLNLSHLNVKNANANISLKSITQRDIHLRIRSLSFKEQSGFCINRLSLNVKANLQRAYIRNFLFEMPHSHLFVKRINATYDIRKSFSQLLPTLHLSTNIDKCKLSTADLRHFIKLPHNIDATLCVSSSLTFENNKLQLQNFAINDLHKQLVILGDLTINRNETTFRSSKLSIKHFRIEQAYIDQIVQWLEVKNEAKQYLTHIGYIETNGNVYYTAQQDAALSLDVQSGVGNVNINGTLQNKQVKALIETKNAQPNLLLRNDKLPTNINLLAKINANISNIQNPVIHSDVKIQSFKWNNYNYQDINTNINYDKNHFLLSIKSNDANAKILADIQASLNNSKLCALHLKGEVLNFNPSELGISSSTIGQAAFRGNLDAYIEEPLSTLPHGNISIENFNMQNSPRGDYALNNLHILLSKESDNNHHFNINSDFLNADVTGDFSVEKLSNTLLEILNRSLPGLIERPQQATLSNDKWHINAELKNTEFFEKVLGANVNMQGTLLISGTLDATPQGVTSLTAHANYLNINGNTFQYPKIYLRGSNKDYRCLIQTHKEISGRDYKVEANLSTHNGELSTQLDWNSISENGYNGTFKSIIQFYNHHKGTEFKMKILPTQFALADTIWNISSGEISHIDKNVSIAGVELSHRNQALRIDGEISSEQNDSIVAKLENIDIDYILDLVDFDAVSFGGKATGSIVFTQKQHEPQVHTHLVIPDFTFNDGLMGSTDIQGTWKKSDNHIQLTANMALPNTPQYGTKVDGYVSLADRSLDLNIHANHTRLAFLRRYIDDLFGNFDGEATGNVRLFGPFKQLDFEGYAKANCSGRILSTGVSYKVSNGDVKFRPGEFIFTNFDISDRRNGTGKASGTLRHTHLKNLSYDFNVSANNLLCYNQGKQNDLPFYSTTTGSGSVHLSGRPKQFVADINVSTNAPSTFVYDLGTQTSFSKDDRMIRFHALNDEKDNTYDLKTDTLQAPTISNSVHTANEDYGTDITLNFLMNVTPTAQIKIITDPRSGDALTVYGDGTLRATWRNKGNFEMYGTYTVNHGEYKISLQDIIRKNLAIQPNSSITFGGNPLDALLSLKTIYTVNGVSLNDLNYGAGFSNKTVRADCILNIGGLARSPQVSFDLDLHNISEDEKQMVRQLISTDEDMSKQVMCLLGVGRFLTATASATNTDEQNSSQQSTAAMRSFLSTTLTSQLNSVISSALGSQSKWSFGTNFMPGSEGWNDMEVDGLLQGRLFNDRLLINGNFGYRDNATYTSNFVGDFDIRYLLTPRGSVSLRAYSETNDRYFTKSSLTTQGVGISLQRDFNSLRDLFRLINRIGKKKNK